MVKRIFDVVVAAIGLILVSPFFCLIALFIRREDCGSVFYRGERIGLHRTPFYIFKFRTMVMDAEKLGASSTSADDLRITRVGKFLRRYKLDELPQLINVLVGDMSLVGPRPEVKKFTDMYLDKELMILTVRPGITDWASIWNSDEGTLLKGSFDPDKDYMEQIRPEKIRLQLKYVQERSFRTDLKIIFFTLKKIIFK